jgi:NTE family protein
MASRPPRRRDDGPVGLVLAGGGARGAYEAGVLSVLLPELARQGARPTVLVGTSAGAINATLFASLAHLPAEEAAAVALDRWRSVHAQMVFRPAWQTLPPLGVRYAAALAGSPDRLTGLLDTGPLGRTLASLLDWEQLRRNLQARTVDALAVVTTECETGRTKVFYQGAGQALAGVPATDDERAMDYHREDLTAEHIRASAAIPIAFPPVRLHGAPGSSWHMDGGVRLNAPLKPAIALGARRLVVVATDPPFHRPSSDAVGRPAPSIQDATGQLLHGAMADRMIEDLIVLAKLNKLLASGSAGARSRSRAAVPGDPVRVRRSRHPGDAGRHGRRGPRGGAARRRQAAPPGPGPAERPARRRARQPRRPAQLPVLRAGVHGRRHPARPPRRRGAPAPPAAVEGRRVPAGLRGRFAPRRRRT